MGVCRNVFGEVGLVSGLVRRSRLIVANFSAVVGTVRPFRLIVGTGPARSA